MHDAALLSQLNRLKEQAREFGSANPALAPFLADACCDPDVERLLEAAAYQTLLLQRKLASDLPELVHDLTQLVLPHYLRPVPATTAIRFTSDSAHSFLIPAGAEIASVPVDDEGTRCRFRTTSDLTFHPLEIVSADFCRGSGRAGAVLLTLGLVGMALDEWQPGPLRLFLAADHALATDLYLLLSRHVTGIVLDADGGGAVTLPPDCLAASGFGEKDALFPYPPHAFPGYRLLQEYFAMPEKFLFFELTGWERWQRRGKGREFTIRIELDSLPCQPQRINKDTVAVNTVPAVNLFAHDADPISVTHRVGSYPVRPAGPPACTDVFSVDHVTGYTRSTGRERAYAAFDSFGCDGPSPVYHTRLVPSASGVDLHLVAAFAEATGAETETLSISLTCTNGMLPAQLHTGDVNGVLTPLQHRVSAKNIAAVHAGEPRPAGPDLGRRLLTHLYLNRRPLDQLKHLRSLLELYVFPSYRGTPRGAAAMMRLCGMESLQVASGCRSNAGGAYGAHYHLQVGQDYFAGQGDVYLFGCVLHRFIKSYAPLNNRTSLTIQETSRGTRWHWPT